MAKLLRGVRVPGNKNTQGTPTSAMKVPGSVSIPMSQHIGEPCQPLVKKGDAVKVGQMIGNSDAAFSVPIYASISGTVTAIDTVIFPHGNRVQTVEIESDGKQAMLESLAPPVVENFADFIGAVRDAGIVGLGGAGFPTHIKLNPANLSDVHTLIVNAAECEPYITCDEHVILEDTDDLLAGIKAVLKFLKLTNCLIAIENNKPQAIQKLQELAAANEAITVKVLPHLYPQGSEKVTIYNTMDGLVVPEGKLPADVGVIVQNVYTVAEIGRYLRTGVPLVVRRVTLDGSAFAEPQNVMAPVGIRIREIAELYGGYREKPAKILMGGSMMGIALQNEEFPLLRNNNAFVFLNEKDAKLLEETPCISCGRCTRVCPMRLMPSRLREAREAKATDQLRKLGMKICMECGCCAYSCPARQELVASHRAAKQMLREEDRKTSKK